MNILITGGCGFIGSYLVRRLIDLKNISRIVVLDIKDCEYENVDFIRMDIRDKNIAYIMHNIDIVIHLAALIDVRESVLNPNLYHDINVNGTLNILDSCIKNHVSKIIFTSSAAVYGNPMYLPIDEKHPLNPLSPYGASKAASELYISAYHYSYNIDAVIFRLFNVYGYGQSSKYAGVIKIFMENALKNRPLEIFGDGFQTRDFIYVEDVIDAIVKSMKMDIDFNIFNIGSGKSLSINSLAKIFSKILDRELKIIHSKPRKGDIRHSYANIDKAKKILGWVPKTSIEDGLRRMLEKYVKESLDS